MLQLEDELAYVIHTIPYRNSSLICDVLTEYHGRVKLLVFSARGPKSKFRGVFRTFSLLKISAKGKTELKKVTQADSVNSLIHLKVPRYFVDIIFTSLFSIVWLLKMLPMKFLWLINKHCNNCNSPMRWLGKLD